MGTEIKASIKGFFEENMISFIKQYPLLLYINLEGKRVLDKDSKHPEIEYTGYYDEHTKTFTGKWEMVTSTYPDDSGEQGKFIEEYQFGKWQMAR